MNNLKDYFQQQYQGSESFLEEVVFPIFGEDNFESGFNDDVLAVYPELQAPAQAAGIKKILSVGSLMVDIETIHIFDIAVSNHTLLARNRVGVQQIVRRIIPTYSSAFMLFHYEDDASWDWRFTFCCKKRNDDVNDGKRFTFLLGPNQSCRTAADNFTSLLKKKGAIEMKDIQRAFSVEALSDEFFSKYKHHYERFVEYVTGKRFVKENGKWVEKASHEPHPQMYADFGRDDKRVRDYVKKLLGRIVFLHFLQKKGWLGVREGEPWGTGDREFMLHLYEYASEPQKADFLDIVLEPLFDQGLDSDRAASAFLFDTGVSLPYGSRVRIPYLNGGLFERDALDEIPTKFPQHFFEDLLTFLSQYNFTIDENDPDDAQVGIDPEMLGRIFENLLEDNKDKGAYYTPKEIVRYMCRQSLIAYLASAFPDSEADIRNFVGTYDVQLLGGANSPLARGVDEALQDVKICDPAIGSGAFPMGLLKELFLCRGAIENFDNPAAIKRHIILQNIYGVDIERGAVDIARLRFWLSLVVDEESPATLPNLDFKIMQGNSLLEQYLGVDLSNLDHKEKVVMFNLFDSEAEYLRKLLSVNKGYFFSCDDHRKKLELRKSITDGVIKLLATSYPDIDWNRIDPTGNEDFFLWHTWFADVFDQGGFDIVIGNPPYIQLQSDGGKLGDLYAPCGFDTFARTGDIYCLFYEFGNAILRPGGHLCYITSNKWMRAAYGEKLRLFFTQRTNPLLLIDFAGVKIFDNATVDPNILLFAKAANQHATRCAVAQGKDCLLNLDSFVRASGVMCGFTGSDAWVILSPIEQSIKRKIEAVGKPLKDWDINIYRGILTGYNNAFIISTAKRDEILANCADKDERKRTAELIRPILRGKDIKRYGYDWADLWLINTHNGIKGTLERIHIEDYPAIKAHLNQYWDKISKRSDKGDTPYNLRNCAYLEDFSKPKIVWKRIGSILRFSFDDDGVFGLDSTCFSTGQDIDYICCVLNSPMGHYLLKDAPKTGTGDLLISVQAIEPLRIPEILSSDAAFFKTRLQSLVAKPSATIEDEIATKIFDLYNLSPEERTYISSHFK